MPAQLEHSAPPAPSLPADENCRLYVPENRPARKNFVLIDYENVQPESLCDLANEQFRVLVFVGAQQSKVPFELANSLQNLGKRGYYVKIDQTGKNALDFHITYYLGQIAAAYPDGHFHIISRDTGFDPLASHLREQGVSVRRAASLQEIPLVKILLNKKMKELIEAATQRLLSLKGSKPRTLKTLSNTINSWFSKKLSEAEVRAIIERLEAGGGVTVKNNRIEYADDQ